MSLEHYRFANLIYDSSETASLSDKHDNTKDKRRYTNE
jgi:hypothetical protein